MATRPHAAIVKRWKIAEQRKCAWELPAETDNRQMSAPRVAVLRSEMTWRRRGVRFSAVQSSAGRQSCSRLENMLANHVEQSALLVLLLHHLLQERRAIETGVSRHQLHHRKSSSVASSLRGQVYIGQVAEALKGLMHQIYSPSKRSTLIFRAYMHDIDCRKPNRVSPEEFRRLVVLLACSGFCNKMHHRMADWGNGQVPAH